jgi:hypothetical protein
VKYDIVAAVAQALASEKIQRAIGDAKTLTVYVSERVINIVPED